MDVRRLMGVLLATVLLVGCQGKPTQGGSVTTPDGTAVAPNAGASDHPGESSPMGDAHAGAAGDAGGDFPVGAAPDVLERHTYNSTQEIPEPGLYFVDVTSGKVEGWRIKGTPDQRVGWSPDNQWVTVDNGLRVVWVKRSTGTSYGWEHKQLQLLASDHGLFLFQRRRDDKATNTFIVANGDFQVVKVFTLDAARAASLDARFAPDGKTVAICVDSGASGQFVGQVYVVDLTTGTSKSLGAQPTVKVGQVVGVHLIQPGVGPELIIGYDVQVNEKTGLSHGQTLVRRYTWQGKLLGEFPLVGQAGRLSPDGRLLSSSQNLEQFAYAVVMTDVTTGQPLFRVVAASSWWWVADSAHLLLDTRDGSQLVSLRGQLTKAPTLSQTETQSIMPGLVPAPDDPHLWAAGMAVIDALATSCGR